MTHIASVTDGVYACPTQWGGSYFGLEHLDTLQQVEVWANFTRTETKSDLLHIGNYMAYISTNKINGPASFEPTSSIAMSVCVSKVYPDCKSHESYHAHGGILVSNKPSFKSLGHHYHELALSLHAFAGAAMRQLHRSEFVLVNEGEIRLLQNGFEPYESLFPKQLLMNTKMLYHSVSTLALEYCFTRGFVPPTPSVEAASVWRVILDEVYRTHIISDGKRHLSVSSVERTDVVNACSRLNAMSLFASVVETAKVLNTKRVVASDYAAMVHYVYELAVANPHDIYMLACNVAERQMQVFTLHHANSTPRASSKIVAIMERNEGGFLLWGEVHYHDAATVIQELARVKVSSPKLIIASRSDAIISPGLEVLERNVVEVSLNSVMGSIDILLTPLKSLKLKNQIQNVLNCFKIVTDDELYIALTSRLRRYPQAFLVFNPHGQVLLTATLLIRSDSKLGEARETFVIIKHSAPDPNRPSMFYVRSSGKVAVSDVQELLLAAQQTNERVQVIKTPILTLEDRAYRSGVLPSIDALMTTQTQTMYTDDETRIQDELNRSKIVADNRLYAVLTAHLRLHHRAFLVLIPHGQEMLTATLLTRSDSKQGDTQETFVILKHRAPAPNRPSMFVIRSSRAVTASAIQQRLLPHQKNYQNNLMLYDS